MNGSLRVFFLLAFDSVLVNLAMIIPFFFGFHGSAELFPYKACTPLFTAAYLLTFYAFRLYNRAWAYASLGELVAIILSVTIGSLGAALITLITNLPFSGGTVSMQWAFIIILVGGSRLIWRLIVEKLKKNGRKQNRPALIIGAGDAGAVVARELNNGLGDIRPVGFIDDDQNKQRLSVLGLPVLGKREDIPSLVKRFNVNLLIIAMPSVESGEIREIVKICRGTRAELRILPGIYQIINGEVSINNLRPVQIEDLLRREPVHIDLEEVAGYLRGETVLVTGAGGSIGSELCRQSALFKPGRLVILGHGENSIHKIWMELGERFPNLPLEIEIADIRERDKIEHVFRKHRPGVVFHAAAHKHVPLMELHPDESVKTNIFGTRNLVDAADKNGVKIFVMISTDKAVNPSCVMGAAKRLAEYIVLQKNGNSQAVFTSVRFGNVLGSNGSVVPIFQRQINSGGPVTVTHPEMKRFFMTIPEAVQLVIQAGAMAQGGEVFVLDMGEPVKIVDLAKDMISLSGLELDKDIEIKFTGIRPGEKLEEELLTAEEGSCATEHKRIFIARPSLVDVAALEYVIAGLSRKGVYCTTEDVLKGLSLIVPGFRKVGGEQVN